MPAILAYDRMGTVRTTDADGRLRVALTPISKANICGYRGAEIPDAGRLGLDPERMYQMLRDPDELRKAAASFNALPVLEEHFHVTAANPRRDLVVGTTGEDAAFDAPYLMNSLTVWDGEAIERIKTGEQRELSSAYRYRADMTPGVYEGEKYDGVMRDIIGSHVAIVPTGRAGPDVLVADAQPKGLPMKFIPKSKKRALLSKLRPLIALDADMEACKKAMDTDISDKVARDDACDTLRTLLGGRVPDEIMDQVLALFENSATEGALNVAEDGIDLEERRDDLRNAGFSDDEIDRLISALANVAEDEDDEQTEADRKREAEGARRADEERRAREEKDRRDESAGASRADRERDDRLRRDREDEAAGARRADRDREERDRLDREHEAEGMRREEERKTAMDAAIRKAKSEAVSETMAAMKALSAAKADVAPFVGEVAMDSADGVYGFALRKEGYDLSGIPASAYGSMFRQHASRASTAKKPVLATDSKSALSFLDKHPGLKAVKVKG